MTKLITLTLDLLDFMTVICDGHLR